MKIDFSQPILALNGEPSTDQAGGPITLGTLAYTALLDEIVSFNHMGQPSPEQITAADKARNGALGVLIYGAKEPLDLDIEQLNVIKDRIGRKHPPLAVVRAYDLLEGREAAG